MEVLKTSRNNIKYNNINKSLNVIKCLAAFAVICIHCGLYNLGLFGEEISALSRFAVPIFFLISGFYSYFDDKNKAINKYQNRLIKLIKLLILSNIFYILISIYTHSFQFQEVFSNFFNLNSWINYVIFNEVPIIAGGHLWFLHALIYCYIIFILLKNFSINISKLYKFIPILLLINIILGEMCILFGFNIDWIYYRNFLFTGLPFFLLGYYIHDKQIKIMNISSNRWIVLIIMSCILVMFEVFITRIVADLYVGTILLATSLFLWCVKNPNYLNFKSIGWIGGNLYTYIYMFFMFFFVVL